jgi:hypothetical protein
MIPEWDISGVLPPIRPGHDGLSPDRSPYSAGLCQVVERFATSPERIAILKGFLEYRAALHGVGIVNGFQWLDGSFIEQIELSGERSPRDIDVVTFFHLPNGATEQTLLTSCRQLFDSSQIKSRFQVDGYPCVLGKPSGYSHVRQVAYWYSMWSHRRKDQKWKGFVQIDLSPQEDVAATAVLNQVLLQEGGVQ